MTKTAEGKFSTAIGRWAGLGPYYAMFPTAFSDAVITKYTHIGDSVLDPFAGRGTSLFSAATSGRFALGIEVNPVGWIYSRTKLKPASREAVEKRLEYLQAISPRYRVAAKELPVFFHHCYSRGLREFLMAARANLNWRRSDIDRTAMAFLLVHLHGKPSDASRTKCGKLRRWRRITQSSGGSPEA